MKKTYIIPQTHTTVVNLEYNLLAGSIKGKGVYDTPASGEKEVLSRESDFSWDDEEDY